MGIAFFLCIVSFYVVMLGRTKLLRRYLEDNATNGKLRVCPCCSLPQPDNEESHCLCGCLVRPFDAHSEPE